VKIYFLKISKSKFIKAGFKYALNYFPKDFTGMAIRDMGQANHQEDTEEVSTSYFRVLRTTNE